MSVRGLTGGTSAVSADEPEPDDEEELFGGVESAPFFFVMVSALTGPSVLVLPMEL
jgi:hypothetical protein